MARSKTLSPEALAVLTDGVRFDGTRKLIIVQKLDRKLYVEVNEALAALGGEWVRKEQAHCFAEDPRDAIDQVVADGCFHKVKQELEQFFTPEALAKKIVKRADVEGMRVLEPSAGDGALARAAIAAGAAEVIAIEIDQKRVDGMKGVPHVYREDFLEILPGKFVTSAFDRVVMNPPFSGQKDIRHVLHAMKFLKAGGKLVAVMSAGVKFRQDRAAKAFRDMLESHAGKIEDLPEGSFKESGTGVNTVLVTMENVSVVAS